MSNPPPEWPAKSDDAYPEDYDRDTAAQNDEAQKVFDTVTGPNLRLADNLIQFVAILAGTAIGMLIGGVYNRNQGGDLATGVFVGGFAGLLLSLFLSGFVIGAVRAVRAIKK